MKKIMSYFLFVLLFISFSALADSTVVTTTSGWRSVPIEVNETDHTYTTVEAVPTDTSDYYYSYKGNRCFREKRDFVGIDAVVFKAGVSGGSDIYCYKE